MTTIHDLTIRKFHEGLEKGEFSCLEIVQSFFAHIKNTDNKIGAYLSLDEEGAIRKAEEVDLAIAKGEEIGFLAGVPLAVKDNILIEGLPATAASKILENYCASYDAGVLKKLKAEKAVILGKTNLDEFAMGSSTENSAFQITRNPHDLNRVPGGSSGGSAAAVAAHLAVAALGSDTGGSIRQPAGFCGVVGLKPTYGAVSRYGLIALASSLDQIGPITQTVEDAALLLNAIQGHDPYDSTSRKDVKPIPLEPPSLAEFRKIKIGIPKEYFGEGMEREVEDAVSKALEDIKSLKLEFKNISLKHTAYALSAYYIIMTAEASANLARYDGIRYDRLFQSSSKRTADSKLKSNSRDTELSVRNIYMKQRALFGNEVKRRVILGTFVLSSGYYDAYYKKAQEVRALIRKDFEEAFKEVDVIFTPVSPTRAFKLGERTADPLKMYLSDVYTIPANLAGLPAISIPVRPAAELPVGFQLIGREFGEPDIIAVGRYYEELHGIGIPIA